MPLRRRLCASDLDAGPLSGPASSLVILPDGQGVPAGCAARVLALFRRSKPKRSPIPTACRSSIAAASIAGRGQQGLEIQRGGDHREFAVGGVGPVFTRAIPVEFDAVLVGIAQVEGFADAVVAGAFEGNAGVDQAPQGVGQIGAGGVEDREVEETGGARCGRVAAEAFPRVETDVVVIAAGGDEGGLGAVALGEFETEHAAVEIECALQVGDLQMDVADAGTGGDGRRGSHASRVSDLLKKRKKPCPVVCHSLKSSRSGTVTLIAPKR